MNSFTCSADRSRIDSRGQLPDEYDRFERGDSAAYAAARIGAIFSAPLPAWQKSRLGAVASAR
jgi:hypothetical protein